MKTKIHLRNRIFSFIILVLVVTFPAPTQALDTINQFLLNHAKSYPRKAASDLSTLVPQLISITSNDAEKAEVLFYWISQNIVYDLEGLRTGDYIMTIPETIRQGKGICHNYAQLYQAMCELAGLECHYIGGYAKGYGYNADQLLKEINHAWNAVKIEGEYLFVDATFGSGFVRSDAGQMVYHPEIRIKEVLEKVGRFSATHLPGSPVWQLLGSPISLQRFQAYESFEEMSVIDEHTVNYLDSLSQFLNLNADWQKVVSAQQTYQFNPTEENSWWLGVAYWAYADKLSGGRYNSRRLRKSLSSYLAAIECFEKIEIRYEAAQQEMVKIRHNVRQVRKRLELKR